MSEWTGTDSRPGGRVRAIWARHDKVRFVVVGGWNTVFGYLAFAGLYLLLGRRYMIAAVLGHVLAVSQAFLAHRVLTFRSHGGPFGEFLRFNLAYSGSLALGLAGLPLLVEVFRVPPLVAQAAMIAVSTLGSYVIHRAFTFRNQPSSRK